MSGIEVTPGGLRAWLDELDAAHRPGSIPPPDADQTATDDERSSLNLDGLWTDDPYCEYSQDEVLHAYRLGAEDQRSQHYNRLLALSILTARLRAILALCDDWQGWPARKMPATELANLIRAAVEGRP